MNNVKPDGNRKGTIKLDHTAMTVNQIFIIGLPILGFIFDSIWPLLFTAAVMLLGLVVPQLRLFNLFYMTVVKPLGLLKPHIIIDDPAPHRFAHLLGGIFLLIAIILLWFGYNILGWVFTWIVVALAQLNLQAHFCVGCFMYLHLSRLLAARH